MLMALDRETMQPYRTGRHALTRKQVETRVHVAIKTLAKMPDTEAYLGTPRAAWPPILREYSESYNRDAVRRRLANNTDFEPTNSDYDRCLDDLDWCRVLDDIGFVLLERRAYNVSWRLLEKQLIDPRAGRRRTYEYWRLLYVSNLILLAEEANRVVTGVWRP